MKTGVPSLRWVTVIVVTLLVGCNSQQVGFDVPDSSGTTSSTSSQAPTFTITEPGELVPKVGVHIDSISEAVRAAISNEYRFTEESLAFQIEVFSDGELTRAEYERAKFAAADCQRARGHNVIGPLQYGPDTGGLLWIGGDPRRFVYTFIVDPGPTASDDGQLCQEIWDFTVTETWVAIHEPTEEEKVLWLEAAWTCARERGLPVSDPPSEREAMNSTAHGCEPWLALPSR